MGIRPVRYEDSSEIADIFISAFPESVRHYYGDRPVPAEGFRDIYRFLAVAEKDNFLVYEQSGKVLGYIVVPKTMTDVWAKALSTGYVFKMAFNWITGKYGISLGQAIKIIRNKLLFAGYSREQLRKHRAQVLSVAVAPGAQGKGIGRALVGAGLDLLRTQGVTTVKLEVRPDNGPAKRIYTSLGFKQVGISRDSQGEWLVMEADL